MDVLIFDDIDDQSLVAGFIPLQNFNEVCADNCENAQCFKLSYNYQTNNVDKETLIATHKLTFKLIIEAEACIN